MRVGDSIVFGKYPQETGGSDRTPIEWIVLRSSADELLVVSKCILDCKPFHDADVDVTWRDCRLRKWLNQEFFHAAFTGKEQQRIVTARCTENGTHSLDTRDKVFLLSVAEIRAFTDPGDGNDTTVMRRTFGTDFAKAKKPEGYSLYVYDKGIQKDYVRERGKKHGCSWWWTRTQTHRDPFRVTFIGARSNIKTYGRVALKGLGVRPALMLSRT